LSFIHLFSFSFTLKELINMTKDIRFDGRVAIITGAGGGEDDSIIH
jgi:hypothetical protein